MDLTSLYCVEFQDDAMAPNFPKGTRAFFRPATHADDRSVVLLEHAGQHLVRYLRRARGGQEAAAVHPAHPTLDEFRIEAVMCMVQQSKI